MKPVGSGSGASARSRLAHDRLSRATTGITATAIVLLIVAGLRTWLVLARPPRPPGIATTDLARLRLAGRSLGGRPEAPIRIFEFADFERFACAQLEPALNRLLRTYPRSIDVTFLHLPWRTEHPFAWPAALAAECAAKQDMSRPYHDVLFRHQATLGAVSWDSLARVAGIANEGAFSHCMRDSSTASRVSGNMQLARELGVVVTPTLVVNGRYYAGGLTFSALDSAVRPLLSSTKTP